MIPTPEQMDGEFGPEPAQAIRKALREGGLPRLLSWLFRQDFRTDVEKIVQPNATPSDIALMRDNQMTGARRVLDFLAGVIGETVKLPDPPFRKIVK